MRFSWRKWLPLLLVVSGVILLDQVTKNWVLGNMALYQTIEPIPALVPYFQLTRSFNTGAAFGLLPQAGILFHVLSMLITAGMVYFYARSDARDLLLHVALSLIIGGALGNVLDRFQHGHVVDFIHYRIPDLISNVSNLADHAIVIGVFLLIIDNFLRERAQKRQAAAAETTSEA